MRSKNSNWGRWGEKDERGAANYVTVEVIKEAVKLIKIGRIYELALPIRTGNVPIFSDRGRRSRCVHVMNVDGGDFAAGAKRGGIQGIEACDDYIALGTHGTTHIDALCHIWYDDKLYNGFSGNTVRSAGARYCGVDKLNALITRGILLDIAGCKNTDVLPPNYVITLADIEECIQKEGVTPRSGDVLLIRTGWINTYPERGEKWDEIQPGIGTSVVPWIIEREFSAVGADNGMVECLPSEDKSRYSPVHSVLIRDHGVYIMELLSLDALADDKVFEFLFIAVPLLIPGGSASPVKPLAIC